MLSRLMEEEGRNRILVSLDNYDSLNLAKADPVLFFQTYKTPLLIDEIQYAPGLFKGIKQLIDKGAQPGDFWISGKFSDRERYYSGYVQTYGETLMNGAMNGAILENYAAAEIL